MMPALAREMVRRNHDLVLGQARDKELVKELRKYGRKGSKLLRTPRINPSSKPSRSWSIAPRKPSAASIPPAYGPEPMSTPVS